MAGVGSAQLGASEASKRQAAMLAHRTGILAAAFISNGRVV